MSKRALNQDKKVPRYLSGERGENQIHSHEAWRICHLTLTLQSTYKAKISSKFFIILFKYAKKRTLTANLP